MTFAKIDGVTKSSMMRTLLDLCLFCEDDSIKKESHFDVASKQNR